MKNYSIRQYLKDECCTFSSTKKDFGGLSNMCSGYKLILNEIEILTSEALYQSLRFPEYPEIQKLIIHENSPMTAKMVSKRYIKKTRNDWEDVKVDVMRWCLKIKLAQHFLKFGLLLESTNSKPIVEISSKDDFWGAKIDKKSNQLTGINALGRLLMELRAEYNSLERFSLLIVEPLVIDRFILNDTPISKVDERQTIINDINNATNKYNHIGGLWKT